MSWETGNVIFGEKKSGIVRSRFQSVRHLWIWAKGLREFFDGGSVSRGVSFVDFQIHFKNFPLELVSMDVSHKRSVQTFPTIEAFNYAARKSSGDKSGSRL